MESMPEINLDTAKATAKKATTSLKSAGSLVAKKAERTKIVTVTLPRACAELGKAVYRDASRRDQFADLFKPVDDLLSQRKKIQETSNSRPSASGMAEKARKVAADATDLAKVKALDLQAYQAFAKLGNAVYQQHGSDSGSPELVEPIAQALARRDQLDSELALAGKEPLNPLWVGLAIWLFFPLGLFLLWRHPTLCKSGKWWTAGIAWACLLMFAGSKGGLEPGVDSDNITIAERPSDNTVASDKPAKKRTRKIPPIKTPPENERIQQAYKEGYEDGASLAFGWLDEVETQASGKAVKAYLEANPLAKANAEEQAMILLKQEAAAAGDIGRVHASLIERGITIGSKHPDADAAEKRHGYAMGKFAGFNAVTLPFLLGK